MRSSRFLQSVLLFCSLGLAAAGCGAQSPTTEVTTIPEDAFSLDRMEGELAPGSKVTLTGSIPSGGWKTHSFSLTSPADLKITLSWGSASADLNLFVKRP